MVDMPLQVQFLLAATAATTVLLLYNKVATPWLRECAWSTPDRVQSKAMYGLWRMETVFPAWLTALHFFSFAVSCVLGSVAICCGVGWVLLTVAPDHPTVVMRTIQFLGKVFATSSMVAILWVPARDGWSKLRRARSDDAVRKVRKLPVTVVTGYLGAGKSTLIQRLLSEQHGMRILVVENELGEVGIDHELLLQHADKEDVILLNNGCLCCRVRRDLVTVLRALVSSTFLEALPCCFMLTSSTLVTCYGSGRQDAAPRRLCH